jgi:uncharacterized protein
MPQIDHHEPGSFCWFELGTTDQDAAKTFYGSLFGWTFEDFPMGETGVYTTFSLDGRNVGASFKLDPEYHKGVPPNWGLYISVENADAAAERAIQLGGKPLMPAFDVAEHGRMAVLADPTGAAFSIWQPKQHPGVGVSGIEGTVCWADLNTSDVGLAREFYSRLFGWEIKPGEKDPSGYLHIFNRGTGIGGIPPCDPREHNAPPHWLLYFWVRNCAAAVQKAQDLGGNVLMPSQDIPNVGSIGILKDPQGAVFAFYQPLQTA